MSFMVLVHRCVDTMMFCDLLVDALVCHAQATSQLPDAQPREWMQPTMLSFADVDEQPLLAASSASGGSRKRRNRRLKRPKNSEDDRPVAEIAADEMPLALPSKPPASREPAASSLQPASSQQPASKDNVANRQPASQDKPAVGQAAAARQQRAASQGSKPPVPKFVAPSNAQLASDLTAEYARLSSQDPNNLKRASDEFTKFFQGSLLNKLREARPETQLQEFEDRKPKMTQRQHQLSEEEEMWKALQDNNWKFSTEKKKGNPIAGRWDRALKQSKELHDKYRQAAGFGGKDAFRAEWCEHQFHKWDKTTVVERKQMHSMTETLDGTYYAMGMIAKQYGGGEEAIASR